MQSPSTTLIRIARRMTTTKITEVENNSSKKLTSRLMKSGPTREPEAHPNFEVAHNKPSLELQLLRRIKIRDSASDAQTNRIRVVVVHGNSGIRLEMMIFHILCKFRL